MLYHSLLYHHLPGKLKQNILLQEFLPSLTKAVYITQMPGNSDMLLEQTLLKSLVLFCFSNYTAQWLEVKMPSGISRQCKDQRNIRESFLGSITFSSLGLMGLVLLKKSWRCEVFPFHFWLLVLYFSFLMRYFVIILNGSTLKNRMVKLNHVSWQYLK